MRKLISLIFEVIKAWLTRNGNTPPKPAETKQKINPIVVGDNNRIVIINKDNDKG